MLRPLPFVRYRRFRTLAPPLDKYSVPSGRTLHAVTTTVDLLQPYPVLGWVLAPLTVLVALYRGALRPHYPGDVLAAAALGVALGTLPMQTLFPV